MCLASCFQIHTEHHQTQNYERNIQCPFGISTALLHEKKLPCKGTGKTGLRKTTTFLRHSERKPVELLKNQRNLNGEIVVTV